MSIRFATYEDVTILVEIGRVYHQESRFKRFTYNEKKLIANLKTLIDSDRGAHCFFVADDKEGKPFATLIGCIESYFYSDDLVGQSMYSGCTLNTVAGRLP
jgi:hypothetical protein